MEKNNNNQIREIELKDFNLRETDLQCLKGYIDLLKKKNEKMNLVSRKSIENLWNYHIVDSLISLFYIKESKHIMDIGSGGGLPGIPLACTNKEKNFILVESVHKKAQFLIEVKEKLQLNNVNVINKRVEDIKKGLDIDIILVRAVSEVKNILKWIRKLLRPGLKIIFYKGSSYKEEIERARKFFDKFKISLKSIDFYKVNGVVRYILFMEIS